jgi:Flp pilus assembly protein TadD
MVRLHARCLLMLDRPREARDLMLTMRGQSDNDGRNATVLGMSAMRLGDTNRMIEAGQSLTQSRPGSADGWVLLGVAALERGDKVEATRLFTEAAAREPSRELPRRLLAQANPAIPVAMQAAKAN